jgi:formylmethanofuran dehydrogenase subunit E-like metal-binding protein
MLADFMHNSSIVEKMRFFAWFVFALYFAYDLITTIVVFRNNDLSETKTCEHAGGRDTQMFVVLEGKVVHICLKN